MWIWRLLSSYIRILVVCRPLHSKIHVYVGISRLPWDKKENSYFKVKIYTILASETELMMSQFEVSLFQCVLIREVSLFQGVLIREVSLFQVS